MTALDVPVILLQIVLPLVLLAWLSIKPLQSVIGYGLQALSTGVGLLAIALTSLWSLPPWWVPILYGILWLVALSYNMLDRGRHPSTRIPQTPKSWLVSIGFSVFGIYGGMLSADALAGRFVTESRAINLSLPLGPGTYLVANGGGTESINAHLLTLHPTTDRQRAYRGQSFAVDLVKIGKFGNRASGWRPRDPQAYAIFGETVFAPCDGTVVTAADDMPDMPVPQPDTTRLEGNHVFLNCGGYGVLMAHFKFGSLLVKKGDQVSTGRAIGKVGNSGQTFEPHLHIHVQELVEDGFFLAGQPLHLLLDGRFPLRNMRLKSPTR